MVMQGNIKRSEQGMVSILVTMIMMIVITLIITAISQATRNNQRQQLDQQLSAQAYYAAESGLNRAVKFFASNATAQLSTNGNCTKFITDPAGSGLAGVVGTDNVLDATSKVSYTCLMVNSTPTSLNKSPVTQDSNAIWRVKNSNGQSFTQLQFKWKPNGSYAGTDTCPAASFTAYANWSCRFGVLRLDLVDMHGTVASTALRAPAKTVYLVPTYNASGVSATTPQPVTASTGQVIYVKCTTSLCDVGLSLPPTFVSNEYYTRLTMIYRDSDSVTLTGTDASGAVKFGGGQAVIDVTGKAQDQLRRVQARIPLTLTGAPMPNFALQSTDTVCKQLGVAPGPGLNTVDLCL